MLAGLFRSNRPAVLLALLVLVPLLFAPALVAEPQAHAPAMSLYGLLQDLLGGHAWAHGSLGMFLVLLLSVQAAFLVNATDQMDRPNYLVALFIPLLMAAFGRGPLFGPALAGMPFVLLALRRTWSVANVGEALAPLFDAGLCIGIAALFHLPYAFLLVVVWVSASLIRPFQWREYVVPCLGAAAVFFVAWGLLRLTGYAGWRPLLTIAGPAGPAGPDPGPQRVFVYLLLGGLLISGVLAFLSGYGRGVMRRKNLRVSFLGLTVALGVIALLQYLFDGGVPAVLMVLPLALFCGYAVQGERRAWLSEAAVLALLVLAFWGQWG